MQRIDEDGDASRILPGGANRFSPDALVDWDYWLNRWPEKPVVLTRANAADGYPKALTPLSEDMVLTFEEAGARRFYFESLRALRPGDCPRPFMQAYYGLVYLNADQMGELGEAMPGSSRVGMFQTILGLDPDPAYEEPARSWRERIVEMRAGLRVGPRVLRLAGGCKARIAGQIAAIDAARPVNPDDLNLDSASQWLDRLEALQIPTWETLMIGAATAIAFFESTEKALTRFVGEGGRDLTNRLHVGLGDNESAESGRAIGTLAQIARSEPATAAAIEARLGIEEVLATSEPFAAELGRVVARFGHRAPAELELANPSWRAEPAQLVDIVRIELHRPAHHDGAAGVRAAAEAELNRRVRGIRRAVVDFLLRRSRDLMAVRENGKIPIVKVFDDTRRLLGAVAPQLVVNGALPDEDAVYYLRYSELKALLAGGPGPGPVELERRRTEHERCLKLDLPELVEAAPNGLRALDDALVVSRGLLPPARLDTGADKLRGIGASPGRMVGTARVLLDPFEDFEPGDVLFAKTVDPGWAPVLSCAGAVVLDMGGLLSHGAVVARELGIPCVVNVKVGTTMARTGAEVTVDGSAGEVLFA